MKTKLFISGLALMAVTVFANAQDPVAGQGKGNCNGPCKGTCKGVAFVDKNKDGVCDNSDTRTANVTDNKVKGNCDGSGMGQRLGKGKGLNFFDANQNGICDTYEVITKK